MKICVFGAGAIGVHLGVRLIRGGAALSVLARGATLTAARAGMRAVDDDGEAVERPAAASDDAVALGVQDAVIVSVKAPALPAVAAAIGPLLGPDTAVAFVMNGVPWWFFPPEDPLAAVTGPLLDPGGAVAAAVGRARTIGGVIYASATILAPGVVRVEGGPGQLVLGEADRTERTRTRALAEVFQAGGMPRAWAGSEKRCGRSSRATSARGCPRC